MCMRIVDRRERHRQECFGKMSGKTGGESRASTGVHRRLAIAAMALVLLLDVLRGQGHVIGKITTHTRRRLVCAAVMGTHGMEVVLIGLTR